jgi:hypothetical protein
MKVGDLVELSAAGQRTQYYGALRNEKGMVIKYDHRGNWVIHWFGQEGQWSPWAPRIKRRFLKHVKMK